MSRVRFECPHCGSDLEADSGDIGVTARCPYCEGFVTLEGAPDVRTATAKNLGSTNVGAGVAAASLGIAILGSLFGMGDG